VLPVTLEELPKPDSVLIKQLKAAKENGVPKIVIGVNKMDQTTPSYDQAKFVSCSDETLKWVLGAGFQPHQVKSIPMTANIIRNVFEDSEEMPWARPYGTLLQAMKWIPSPPPPVPHPFDGKIYFALATLPLNYDALVRIQYSFHKHHLLLMQES